MGDDAFFIKNPPLKQCLPVIRGGKEGGENAFRIKIVDYMITML
jgi:hypothetical protein